MVIECKLDRLYTLLKNVFVSPLNFCILLFLFTARSLPPYTTAMPNVVANGLKRSQIVVDLRLNGSTETQSAYHAAGSQTEGSIDLSGASVYSITPDLVLQARE